MLKFKVINFRENAPQDAAIAVAREGRKLKMMPFFDMFPLLDGINKEHGANVRLISNRRADGLLSERNWDAWKRAGGLVRNQYGCRRDEFLFATRDFVAYGRPEKPLGEWIGFKPILQFDHCNPKEYDDHMAMVTVPAKHRRLAEAVLMIRDFSSSDFHTKGMDYLIDMKRALAIPGFGKYRKADYRCEPEAGIPVGETGDPDDKETRQLHRLYDEYAGPIIRGVELFNEDYLRIIFMDSPWICNVGMVVEIPMTDLPKLRLLLEEPRQ